MTRRTAFQSLVAIIAGAMDPGQKTTPTKVPVPSTTSNSVAVSDWWNRPQSLSIHLNWKDITVRRGDESVTIDQDELFKALKLR